MRLIALKSMRYATRDLRAGDAFEASGRDARVLVATRRARVEHETPDTPSPAPVPEIHALRQQYQAKFGKRPFMGWDEDDLRSKLADEGDNG